MFRAEYTAYPLVFRRPAGTSRGMLHRKECWFIGLTGPDGTRGIGEVSFIPGLSVEDPGEIGIQLDHVCKLISRGEMQPAQPLPALPGIQFALESALADLNGGGNRVLFPSAFTEARQGIPTNGLIWMGDRRFMTDQVREKIDLGFRVLKLKVGALDFDEELELLRWVREEYAPADLEIRVDANGAWSPEEAMERMDRLSRFGIHSIEQPIAPGQAEAMAELCAGAAVPVALDEELIGIPDSGDRQSLLEKIRPAYVILKPGLLGGFSAASDWIRIAGETGSGWWVTSALESTVGLNAIAQWTYTVAGPSPTAVQQGPGDTPSMMHQGLGTGQIYANNLPSPLEMKGEMLWYRPERNREPHSVLNLFIPPGS